MRLSTIDHNLYFIIDNEIRVWEKKESFDNQKDFSPSGLRVGAASHKISYIMTQYGNPTIKELQLI